MYFGHIHPPPTLPRSTPIPYPPNIVSSSSKTHQGLFVLLIILLGIGPLKGSWRSDQEPHPQGQPTLSPGSYQLPPELWTGLCAHLHSLGRQNPLLIVSYILWELHRCMQHILIPSPLIASNFWMPPSFPLKFMSPIFEKCNPLNPSVSPLFTRCVTSTWSWTICP